MKHNKTMDNLSVGYQDYLKNKHKKRKKIVFWQLATVVLFILLWEVLARLDVINTFLLSSPSAIVKLFVDYLKDGSIFTHIAVSVWETVLGFAIGTVLGIIIAIILISIKQIDEYERGVKFTMGKFSKTMEPGWNLVLPIFQSFKKSFYL